MHLGLKKKKKLRKLDYGELFRFTKTAQKITFFAVSLNNHPNLGRWQDGNNLVENCCCRDPAQQTSCKTVQYLPVMEIRTRIRSKITEITIISYISKHNKTFIGALSFSWKKKFKKIGRIFIFLPTHILS